MRKRISEMPLLWRVYATNATALTLATLALVLAPITVSAPVSVSELLILLLGLVVLLALNLALLRPAFRPLDELVSSMRRHDPLAPGERVVIDGGPVVSA